MTTKRTKTKKKPAAGKKSTRQPRKRAVNNNGVARRASLGDTAPTLTEKGIERFTVSEHTKAAREAKVAAVHDAL